MFCQCYFNAQPADHPAHEGEAGGHYCKFNNAYRVNHGSYGDVKLDGARFWLSGDLGGELSKGQFDFAKRSIDLLQQLLSWRVFAGFDPR